MSLPVYVDAYSGYKANERPCQFTLEEQIYEIDAVLDQWYEPSATYFKVQSTEGKTYLLRYDEYTNELDAAHPPSGEKTAPVSSSQLGRDLVLRDRFADHLFKSHFTPMRCLRSSNQLNTTMMRVPDTTLPNPSSGFTVPMNSFPSGRTS